MQPISTDRRQFIKAAGVLAMATAASGIAVRMADAQQVPYSTGTEPPMLKAPANACDCHIHIYDARYPVAPTATLKPAYALVADYKLLQKRIGTTRNVVVTPSTYGTDNRITLDAIAQLGAAARGVAVVDTSVNDGELRHMHDLGIRGIHFNLVQAGATTVSAHTLFDIVRKLPEGSQVELTAAEGKMQIIAGRSRFNLSTLPRDDFPVIAEGDLPTRFELPAATLRQIGFQRAIALDGWIKAWREAGYPLVSG